MKNKIIKSKTKINKTKRNPLPKITWEQIQQKQDKIISILNKKLDKKEQKLLSTLLETEYILAMMEEGHSPEEFLN